MGIGIETIGWLGAVLLATCGLPQLLKTIKTKDFSGLSLIFIIWWFLGEIFMLTYIMIEAFRIPLLFNYGINIIVCIVIFYVYYKYKVKK